MTNLDSTASAGKKSKTSRAHECTATGESQINARSCQDNRSKMDDLQAKIEDQQRRLAAQIQTRELDIRGSLRSLFCPVRNGRERKTS